MKKKKILLFVSAVIVLILAVAFVANYDLIMVIKDGLFETQETISQKKDEETLKQEQALKDAGVSNVRPLTEEETKELTEGNLSEEEVVKIITGQATMEDVKENKNNTGQKNEEKPQDKNNPAKDEQPENNKPSQPDNKKAEEFNNKIAELVGKIYIIEARFTSEIGALEKWAVDEYNHTKKAEKAQKKKELAAYGLPKLTALEQSCDSEVNAVLAELQKVLKEAGQSTELVNQIKDAYMNKKKLTKSYYLSEYM